MQVSGMSQSLTASRHVAPLSSYCQKTTMEGDGKQSETKKAGGEREASKQEGVKENVRAVINSDEASS